MTSRSEAGAAVTLTYTNWRGETAERTLTPTGRVLFTSNEWHPEPQWLVEASGEGFDGLRAFALKGFGHPTSPAEAARMGSGVDASVRPEVAAFALLMEHQLRANDHKPGWKNDHTLALAARVQQEADELAEAVHDADRKTAGESQRLIIASEAADVANMAMMVADVCGCLAIRPATPPQEAGNAYIPSLDYGEVERLFGAAVTAAIVFGACPSQQNGEKRRLSNEADDVCLAAIRTLTDEARRKALGEAAAAVERFANSLRSTDDIGNLWLAAAAVRSLTGQRVEPPSQSVEENP